MAAVAGQELWSNARKGDVVAALKRVSTVANHRLQHEFILVAEPVDVFI
jgi:hypothetical protein